MSIAVFGTNIELDTLKFIVSSCIQVALGISAALLTWRLARDKGERENADLKLKLYERRYDAYLAFEEFISHCVVQDLPSSDAIRSFLSGTDRIDFLFGREIAGYKREALANATALFGIVTGAPCTSPPTVGGVVGYFPGSTVLTTVDDLREWFYRQRTTELMGYFRPYLDFQTAGVDQTMVRMKPPTLPEPPLIRRMKSQDIA